MAKNSGGQGTDNTLTYIIVLIVALAAGYWAFTEYAWAVLIPWKWLRVAELSLTGQIDIVSKMLDYRFVSYGAAFDAVNGRVSLVFRVIMGLVGIHALYYLHLNMQPGWSMEAYLHAVYNRFPWLAIVYRAPKGITFNKKFPFISFDVKHQYHEVGFPEGVEPLTYLAQFEDILPEKLKGQLGPALEITDKKIVWKDQFAKTVAYECFKRIPDKKPNPDAKSWRDQAWQRCVKTHRFERTFALGMLQSARDFGVMSSTEILHLRRSAGLELASGRDGAFQLWRAVLSLGGRCAYAEGSGIMCHYHFERSLSDYLVTHPDDYQIAHFMRSKPWVLNALNSFTDVRDIVMNSPDVVALKKAGLYKP